MTNCKGAKCKSAKDCDDCVVKAARKASAKKTKERNAMLLLKAKILEKMPKAAPVDPFASYRNLPRKQHALAPSPQNLTLQNVADEIERAFARRDKRSEAPSGVAAPSTLEKPAREVQREAELESTTWLMPFAAPRKAPTLSFEPQVSSLNIKPTVGRFFPEEAAPSLEESVMELTDVSEFDDEDAMEALDEAMAPGAAALSASTEEAAADEVRIASDEPFVMDPIWEATLASRVPPLDLSSVAETSVPSNLYSDPLLGAIAESGEEVMGAPAESLSDAIRSSENRIEAEAFAASLKLPRLEHAKLSVPTLGVGMDLPMDLKKKSRTQEQKDASKLRKKERAEQKESFESSRAVQESSAAIDAAVDESLEVPVEPYVFLEGGEQTFSL